MAGNNKTVAGAKPTRKKPVAATKKKFSETEKKSYRFKQVKGGFAKSYTPKELFEILNRYVVSQEEAKKKIAIAFANRSRRLKIGDKRMRESITPKNVIMSGPTGVGKSEIARRIAKETDSPFLKVEMTKFTEVGYAGRDCDSIIKDLVSVVVKRAVKKARDDAYEKYYDICMNNVLKVYSEQSGIAFEEVKKSFNNGELDEKTVLIDIPDRSFKGQDIGLGNLLNGMMDGGQISFISFLDPKETIKKKERKPKEVNILDAIEISVDNEITSAVDEERLVSQAVEDVQNNGIVFLDEIDKLISRKESQSRGEVSREGVQRDLLALIEGTVVHTKYGPINTEHILFIAAGAFYDVKVNDLMPELQGRFPIQVELKNLTVEDFEKILNSIEFSLIEQISALLGTDGIKVSFLASGIKEVAKCAYELNMSDQNIGARRLNSVIDQVLEEVSFDGAKTTLKIDGKYVKEKMEEKMKKKIKLDKYTI